MRRVGKALTAHFGPDTVLLDVELEFHAGLVAEELVAAVGRIEAALRRDPPELKYIFVEGAALGAPAAP